MIAAVVHGLMMPSGCLHILCSSSTLYYLHTCRGLIHVYKVMKVMSFCVVLSVKLQSCEHQLVWKLFFYGLNCSTFSSLYHISNCNFLIFSQWGNINSRKFKNGLGISLCGKGKTEIISGVCCRGCSKVCANGYFFWKEYKSCIDVVVLMFSYNVLCFVCN